MVTAGSVGSITFSPADATHSYRVRLVNGDEVMVTRDQMSVLKEYQRTDLMIGKDVLADFRLDEYVIYRCVTGSQAYGLSTDQSDKDIRGIYLPPAELTWSLYGVPEQLENKATEEVFWELQKFLILALKANPNILECLFTPMVEFADPLAEELLDMKGAFLSKLIYQTYNGYVMSQFKKLSQDVRTNGNIRWKHAMHLVRLLLSGITVLREGYVPIDAGAHREKLLQIRAGELPWEQVDAWRLALHEEFEDAYLHTRLPDHPDYERANTFLLRARRQRANRG